MDSCAVGFHRASTKLLGDALDTMRGCADATDSIFNARAAVPNLEQCLQQIDVEGAMLARDEHGSLNVSLTTAAVRGIRLGLKSPARRR
jgi:hypothetical protein